MANVPNNKISHVFTPEQMERIREHIQGLRTEFSVLEGQIDTNRRSLIKIEGSNKVFVEDCIRVMKANPQLVPPHVNVVETEKDYTLHAQADEVLLELNSLSELARGAQIQAGHEAYKASLEGYNHMDRVAKSGDPLAVTLYNGLKPRFIKSKSGAAAKAGKPAPEQ
jgi:hypothetical protein